MDEIAFQKSLVELQSFHQNLQGGSVEEQDVLDYHRILESIESQIGLSLRDFFIPDERLKPVVTGTSPPMRSNRFQSQTHYSSSRYCEHDFFLRKLDAAILFIDGLLPKPKGKDQIGF